jgi:hypothetical protein
MIGNMPMVAWGQKRSTATRPEETSPNDTIVLYYILIIVDAI